MLKKGWGICLGVIWLAVSAGAALGGDWVSDGGSLNIRATHYPESPTICLVGSTPYVAWFEPDPVNYGAPNHIYARRFVNGAWELLGNYVSDPATESAMLQPKIKAYNSVPYVAYTYGTAGRVRSWNGTAWANVGGAYTVGTYTLNQQDLELYNGTPYVMLNYANAGVSVGSAVQRLNGSTWQTVATQQVSVQGWDMIFLGGTLYTAASQGSSLTVYALQNNAWVSLGILNRNAAQSAGSASLAEVNGLLYVVWIEGGKIQCSRRNGSTWENVGSDLGVYSGIQSPAAVGQNGHLYVTWSEYDPVALLQRLFAYDYNGSAWTPLGGMINLDPVSTAIDPEITALNGIPYVTWLEIDLTADNFRRVYVKHYDVSLSPTPTPTPPFTTWIDEYVGGAPGTKPYLYEDARTLSLQSMNAMISYTGVNSYAEVLRCNGPVWGHVLSPTLYINTYLYKEVSVKVDYISPGATWKLGVYDGGGYTFRELISSQSGPGLHHVNLGYSGGVRAFKLSFVVEGTVNQRAVLDYISIHQVNPTPTPTPSPVPNQSVAWEDHFVGPAGEKAANWWDEANDSSCDATIAYSYSASHALINHPHGTWGKVLSPKVTVDVDAFPKVEINVAKLLSNTSWKLGIQETEGAWRYWDVSSSTNDTGTFSFDYRQITGLTGTHQFSVQIIVEGAAGRYIEVGHVRIYYPGVYTPTVTPSATITPTPVPEIWTDDFSGTAGVQPSKWSDDTQNSAFHAQIAYSSRTDLACAAVTRTAGDVWGKILSEVITCNTGVHNQLEIKVAGLSPGGTWKVGIQEEGGSYQYWDLNTSSAQTGTFAFNYPTVTGWSGTHAFRIQFTLEGDPGRYAELDWVRLCQAGTVHGSNASALSGQGNKLLGMLPTNTPTISPTPQATGTPTPTSTPTQSRWVESGKVVLYPNPAREHVGFAYTVEGRATLTVDIYKLTGERVAHLQEQVQGTGGTQVSTWNAHGVAPGIYLCRIELADGSGQSVYKGTRKVALIH